MARPPPCDCDRDLLRATVMDLVSVLLAVAAFVAMLGAIELLERV
jgi:hypothetical protein